MICSPTVAKCLNNSAADLNSQKNFVEAETVIRKSLAILKKQVASDHSLVAVMMFNIAQTERNQGKYERAELDILSAITIVEKIEPNPPNLEPMKKAHAGLAAYNKKRRQMKRNTTSNQMH
jgi:hypothetical protein